MHLDYLTLLSVLAWLPVQLAAAEPQAFFRKHCLACHAGDAPEGGFDLTALKPEFADPAVRAKWVKVHDRLLSGEMPPKSEPRPEASEVQTVTTRLAESIIAAERQQVSPASGLRRLTRAEYEQTLRDLFDLPGLPLQGELPPDGTAHGFDKHADGLELSHVHVAKYLEAADRVLDAAIATRPTPPQVVKMRTSLAYPAGFVAHVILHGDGVLLKNKQPHPVFPPAGAHEHLDQGAHERIGMFSDGSTVGLFRHEDESFHPYFNEFVTIYPGHYRIRTSLWSFQWDKGKVLPARGTEAARLSIVTLTGDGRGGGHPSRVLTYLDAPSLTGQTHELTTWLNVRDTLGFNAASLAPGAITRGPLRAMGFTGPGIACDWLEFEGPLHEVWPPVSHRRLFGELPLAEFKPAEQPGIKPPPRNERTHPHFPGTNRPDPVAGIWTVHSSQPLEDADRLLADFLPRAFRRPVSEEVRRGYVEMVNKRLQAGDCYETALRWAYRAALCSPDFLYHLEAAAAESNDELDSYALACRLSYFLWNSLPDQELTDLAAAGELGESEKLREQTERLLRDPKAQRFIDDFLGQWLKLRQIAATDPDRKLYPEFSTYLQDSMVAETRAYFRELLEKNLDAGHLVRSDFVMINEKLAAHYGIEGVSGPAIRRVPLPPESPRGGLLTQASILKITANGTTTSPVPRGAFVLERLLGHVPEPPPPNIAAVEPDVRGTTTIREQLDKHRNQAVCASCHARMDPPGHALESFDVIGGFRTRYRSIGEGDPAPRGVIDPFIPISFRLGQAVDASGELPDGTAFNSFREFQALLAADQATLLHNMARQLLVYSTGRELTFSDRAAVTALVERTRQQGGGLRTLIHELVQSPLFRR